ncbi:MAG: hypothetical protein K8I29_13145 [Alphaproteobacteria bacterium]|uniref:Uncharacterized protein n=1 Tax=Candidatus Nitrobium versatile TaxID=2884831 RepID=A0A953JDJ8_9BACT|nr:hypothetical protein [Candidatus Nitrobium versatile]
MASISGNTPARPSCQGIREITLRWWPYAGMLYFHLLLRKLQAKGFVP